MCLIWPNPLITGVRPSVCQSGLTSPSHSLAIAFTRYCLCLFSPLLPSLLLFLCSFLVSFVNHSSQCSYLLALPLIALALTPPAPLLLPLSFVFFLLLGCMFRPSLRPPIYLSIASLVLARSPPHCACPHSSCSSAPPSSVLSSSSCSDARSVRPSVL